MRKEIADAFINALRDRPSDFEADGYVLRDKATGIHWWVGNGLSAFGMYRPYDDAHVTISSMLFGWATQKGRCWRAFEKWRADRIATAVNEAFIKPPKDNVCAFKVVE